MQSDLFDEAGIELPDEIKDQLSDEIEIKSHSRKKHPVRRSLPKDLPREIVVHDIPPQEKICECGTHVVKIGEEVTEQLKYIPAQLSVIRHVRPKYACKPCQENVKIASMPTLFLPKSIATPELVAYTIIAKYCDHLPLYRQESIWNRLEIDMPRSSLCGWILKMAELCEPLINLLQKNIISCDYVQADETTVQVLNEVGRDNTAKSYMWCYRGGGEKISIVYEYQRPVVVITWRNFCKGIKAICNQTPILAIPLQIKTATLCVWAAWHMHVENLLMLLKQQNQMGWQMKRSNTSVYFIKLKVQHEKIIILLKKNFICDKKNHSLF